MADEFMDAELGKWQDDWDKELKHEEESQFKAGKQLVYISDFRWAKKKDTEEPLAIFDIAGAEDDNTEKAAALFFRITKNRTDVWRLQTFLKALEIDPKIQLVDIEEAVDKIKNRVWNAKIELATGGKGGVFVNATPLGFKDTDKAAKSGKDLPF
jgi:hypothetical protein